MKVTNKTHWRTVDLKRIMHEALRRYSWHDREKVKDWNFSETLHVKIVHTRVDRGCGGRAWLNSYSLTMRVSPRIIEANDFAAVFTHEVMHCLGFKHDQIPSRKTLTEEAIWATTYPINKWQSKVKPKQG